MGVHFSPLLSPPQPPNSYNFRNKKIHDGQLSLVSIVNMAEAGNLFDPTVFRTMPLQYLI